ncbi:MAG: hypothetical protein J5674_03800 [Candidatus Methanomethylophilaceae archaeon]|nr:hypothetical protein [Candidatus Methanomethylophilaceae archaeon]
MSSSRRFRFSTRYAIGGIKTTKLRTTRAKSHMCTPPPYMLSRKELTAGTQKKNTISMSRIIRTST